MPPQSIKVGPCIDVLNVIPVRAVFDGIFQCSSKNIKLGHDRYQLLEIDGYWLIIHEWMDDIRAHQEFICLETERDAWKYLDMCGIDKPGDD